jgi:hypothetical protein
MFDCGLGIPHRLRIPIREDPVHRPTVSPKAPTHPPAIMSLTVSVKWGKQKFEGVELDTSAPVELFKAQLYALTQVPPERQKIMGVKGGTVKDDANWADLGIKQGQVLQPPAISGGCHPFAYLPVPTPLPLRS